MRNAPLAFRRLSLGNSEFLKEINLSFHSLIMVDAHYDQITLPIGCQVHGLILRVADGGYFPCPVS
jgi:hypothetical protein